jgi:hypothetical protein
MIPYHILVGEVGFEPTSLAAKDFKSFVYTVPPLARLLVVGAEGLEPPTTWM